MVREKLRLREWKLVKQGLRELEVDEMAESKTGSNPIDPETAPYNLVAPPLSPLGNPFNGNFSSLLPDLLSYNTPITFP